MLAGVRFWDLVFGTEHAEPGMHAEVQSGTASRLAFLANDSQIPFHDVRMTGRAGVNSESASGTIGKRPIRV